MIGGDNNIWNNININNRPGWGLLPGGDWWSHHHGDHWHDHWHDHHIHHHHGWYHGCWNNHWGSGWYAPVAWGVVGWGLGSWYGAGSYYNPYYSASAALPYDYSQPVVVTNYVVADDGSQQIAPAATTAAAPLAPSDAALSQFDQALADFKAGNYRQAQTRLDAAVKQLPGDPVVHEVRALAQFATGDYGSAAAGLNSLLATAPGMDWTTMSGLYGDLDDYTEQLRRLESYCKNNATDAAAHFVLAYHYLVTGSQDAAIDALKVVVRQQPKDTTAKRMLDSLAPTSSAASDPTPATTEPPSTAQTDLVGSWQAKGGDTTIELTIGDDSQFTWKASQSDKPPIELRGDAIVTSEMLVLENKEQGSIVGRVKSDGPNQWQFALAGAPPSDPGLTFTRLGK